MSTPSESEHCVSAVQNWLQKWVIGLNFCPFAKKEFERKTIQYTVDKAQTSEQALNGLLAEIQRLEQEPGIETSLLIYPAGFADFDDYLDWLELANTLVAQGGYRGIYQLASFHPDYCFEGEAPDDPANYTNRAPYPIVHILREASLERVLKQYPDPDSIPANNIAKCRELGAAKLLSLLK